MNNERITILQNAILQFGKDRQIEMAVEEMGELLAAINKCKRGRCSVSAVQEEIADVKIMMGQLAIIFGEDGVSSFERLKLRRLADRIIKQAHKVK